MKLTNIFRIALLRARESGAFITLTLLCRSHSAIASLLLRVNSSYLLLQTKKGSGDSKLRNWTKIIYKMGYPVKATHGISLKLLIT